MGLVGTGTGTASLLVLPLAVFQRQEENRPESLKAQHPAPPNLTPSRLGLLQKPQLFVQGRTKIHQQKQQGAFGFTKKGKKTQSRHPASGRSRRCPCQDHCPRAGEGSLLTQFLTSPPGLRAAVVGTGGNKDTLLDQRKILSSQKDQG